ncbi:MAG: phosphoenolpyruvate--protein phosphotransferase [Xanthomonadaceae bacterium]|jgi:phosphotransferase system enzyme I (PtsI)|nr:phosphoenolpyruvate--protein phosphotransferase [Xanthomonadaceae bacterium]
MRLQLAGTGASPGHALGRARIRQPHILEVDKERISAAGVPEELQRLHRALRAAREEMRDLRKRLQGALAEEAGEFIELHALLLDDPELLHNLDSLIREEHYSADYALRVQRDRLATVFGRMEDDYLKSRLDDLDHIIGRIHAHLHEREATLLGAAGDILIGDAIAPSELAQLQAQGVIAVVTATGSALSHSAILARSLHLPLIIGATHALQKINDGDVLIVDAETGHVILNPSAEDLRGHRARLKQSARERRELERLRGKPSRTLDGADITLYANAESNEDVIRAHALGATGIGLYRTEFLFLGQDRLPDEEEQFRVYRNIVLSMDGRPVTIRTLDLGSDKGHEGLTPRDEDNPALGLRGIRLSLAHPAHFDVQLRAIARASAYGRVRILIPMISRREELLSVRRRLRKVSEQLRAEGHQVAESIPLGTMIEVPAVAIAVQSLMDVVDFLSIGTNDLVQYLLAADRCNEALDDLYSPLHPGVLQLLNHVIETSAHNGKPVAICGEIAGDPWLTRMLLALGLTEFSLHPNSLLEVRRIIRNSDLGLLRAASPKLLQARDRAGIQRWLAATGQA